MKKKYTNCACAAVAALLFAPFTAKADALADLSHLSHSLEKIADALSHEFSDHYRNSRSYAHLVSDIRKIRSEASHLHALARNHHPSLHHIEQDVEDLDKLAHHLHNMVNQIERDAGHFAFRAFGDTRHVHSGLASLNSTIHSLERAASRYEREQNHGHHGRQPVVIQPRNPVVVHPRTPVVRQPPARPPSPRELHRRLKAAIFGRR